MTHIETTPHSHPHIAQTTSQLSQLATDHQLADPDALNKFQQENYISLNDQTAIRIELPTIRIGDLPQIAIRI